ncbi:MAG: hypothetical protein AB7V58_09645 [Solirubrobacterales bacterium]
MSSAAATAKPRAKSRSKLAKRWTCNGCGVSVGRIGGEKVELPDSWTSDRHGTYCLICRRERAAQEALEAAPEDSGLEERAKLRRSALIEFEVRRRPGHGDGEIARTCRSSVAAVAAARRRLKIPKPH